MKSNKIKILILNKMNNIIYKFIIKNNLKYLIYYFI